MSVDKINLNPQHQLAKSNERFIPKPYKDIAQSMEKQFIEFMLDKMGNTVPGQSEKDTATKYYESVLKSERANLMAQNNGGLGIQEMVLNQIYPRKVRTNTGINAYKQNNQNKISKEIIANSINDSLNNFSNTEISSTSKEESNE